MSKYKPKPLVLYGRNHKGEIGSATIHFSEIQDQLDQVLSLEEFSKYQKLLNNKMTIKDEDISHDDIPQALLYDLINILKTEEDPYSILECLVDEGALVRAFMEFNGDLDDMKPEF